MTLILLTGCSGVGKTTIQDQLATCTGAHILTTVTSRRIDKQEKDIINWDVAKIQAAVKSGDLVAPIIFGCEYYAWLSGEVDALYKKSVLHVANVRPYTALLLTTFIPDTYSIYLFASPEVVAERRKNRGETRDSLSEARTLRDEEDSIEIERYRSLFQHQVLADENAVSEIRLIAEI